MIRCVMCLRPRPRRWWQCGILAPLPICPPAQAVACQRIADHRPTR